tara:strand:- start:274 stop:405 length:132 start_codon:yes stop_codon:yes gene_type:complete
MYTRWHKVSKADTGQKTPTNIRVTTIILYVEVVGNASFVLGVI